MTFEATPKKLSAKKTGHVQLNEIIIGPKCYVQVNMMMSKNCSCAFFVCNFVCLILYSIRWIYKRITGNDTLSQLLLGSLLLSIITTLWEPTSHNFLCKFLGTKVEKNLYVYKLGIM